MAFRSSAGVRADARAVCLPELAPADAEFYLTKLNRLPGPPDEQAVTLDLSGSIAIRAKTLDTPTPTSTKELIRALKTEKRSQKSLKLALDSLKQLQAAA